MATEVLDGAAHLLTARTRRQAHVDLHMAHEGFLVLVFPEADVASLLI